MTPTREQIEKFIEAYGRPCKNPNHIFSNTELNEMIDAAVSLCDLYLRACEEMPRKRIPEGNDVVMDSGCREWNAAIDLFLPIVMRLKARVEFLENELAEAGKYYKEQYAFYDKEISELKEHVNTNKVVAESNRFKKLSDGWILDKALGIEWGPSSQKRMDWSDAKKYAEEQGGRLPTVKELRSLVDYDRREPAIDTQFFPDTKTDDWYWTGTEDAGTSDYAWSVGFYYGFVGYGSKNCYDYVRPCRASQEGKEKR